MENTWVVSANASRARFFSQAAPSDSLEEISDMVNNAVRLRAADTERDKLSQTAAGKSRRSTGGALPNSSYEPAQTPERHETERFARDVAAYLLRAHQERRFRKLSLVAAPQFLGALRPLLDPAVESAIAVEIDKDYTRYGPDQLREQIQAHRQRK